MVLLDYGGMCCKVRMCVLQLYKVTCMNINMFRNILYMCVVHVYISYFLNHNLVLT